MTRFSNSTYLGEADVPGSDTSHLEWWIPGLWVGGNSLFVVDTLNSRVLKCTGAQNCAVFAGTTGETGQDNTHFEWPSGVAADSSGYVYVSDWGNHRIQKFNSAGGYVSTLGSTKRPYDADRSRYNGPRGIAVAADGSIYFTENRGYRLVKLNLNGNQRWAIGQAGVYAGDGVGQGLDNQHFGSVWSGPEGNVAIDGAGRVYVTDTGNHRLQIFRSNGEFVKTFGSQGTGAMQFDCPAGVAISPVNGDVYVVDRCNQRIQVYNNTLTTRKAQLGVTGQEGDDNWHFRWPWGVAVDSTGAVYVADQGNYRVQKCTLSGDSGTCSTFAGEAGVIDDDFGHLEPYAIAVDSARRVYVADCWNNRVQVFDSAGAYLTTIGGIWGPSSGQFRAPTGVAVDATGAVYVADSRNHRIQKFVPGVTGWSQVNINGFGNVRNRRWASALAVGSFLYVGTQGDTGDTGELWRSPDGAAWSRVSLDDFDSNNTAVIPGASLGGFQYLGTQNTADGGEVWRSADGTNWSKVQGGGFGDPGNTEVQVLAVFSDTLYAYTTNESTGVEVWRSTGGTNWTQVNEDGFGDSDNWQGVGNIVPFNGYLYVGTAKHDDSGDPGGELWRCQACDGTDWEQVGGDGFADPENNWIVPLADLGGYLYVGTANWRSGGQVWRSSNGTDWEKVVSDGLGDANNQGVFHGAVLGNALFAATYKPTWAGGCEIWRTTDGVNWDRLQTGGFGDSNNESASLTAFNNHLYVATMNWANGAEVWRYFVPGGGTPTSVYLPAVFKGATGTGTCAPSFYDGFNSCDPWDTPLVRFACVGGELQIWLKTSWTAWGTWNLKRDPDYVIGVDVRFASSVPGEAGLFFDRSYMFKIRTDGRYSLWKWTISPWDEVEMKGWTETFAYKAYPATNRLKVVREGPNISLYMNEEFLYTVTDTQYRGLPEFGVRAVRWGQDNNDVRFDNLTIYPIRCEPVATEIKEIGPVESCVEPEAGQGRQCR